MKLYKIKPLEWRHEATYKRWVAKIRVWKYVISESQEKYFLTIYTGFVANGISAVFETLEKAKEYCSLDITEKMLEGLEEVSQEPYLKACLITAKHKVVGIAKQGITVVEGEEGEKLLIQVESVIDDILAINLEDVKPK